MKITVYNAVTKKGLLYDGDLPVCLVHDNTRLKKLIAQSDSIVVDGEYYKCLLSQGILPVKDKFVVVSSSEDIEHNDNIWVTNLDIKQIRRELKIQGFKNVLCVGAEALNSSLLKAKIVNALKVTKHNGIEGEGGEMLKNLDKAVINLNIDEQEEDGDMVHIHYRIK